MGKKGSVKEMSAVFATDEKYAPYLSAAIESLGANLGAGVSCSVTVMHAGLSERTSALLCASSREGFSVRTLDVSGAIEDKRDRLYSTSYLSPEMYYRALIPELMPDKRVLYLDCDIAVLSDLSELYFADMRGYAVLGAKNPMHPKMRAYVASLGLDPEEYINSGVLLMDCEKLRRLKFTERFFSELSSRGELKLPDQDLINILLGGEIGYLSPRWNYLFHIERLAGASSPDLRMEPAALAAYTAYRPDARIIHYTGDMKPWEFDALPLAEHFWRYAELCPMRSVISERRRAALLKRERVRLVFADLEAGQLRLTCAHAVPQGLSPRPLSYTLLGRTVSPEPYFVRDYTSGGINMKQRLFSVDIPLGVGSELVFSLSGKPTLFEYDAHFPLNGVRASYFTLGDLIVFRRDRALVAEPCSLKARLRHELSYLGELLRRGGNMKYVLLRAAYPALRRILPRRVWLLSDRPEVAGDNAEALFRYLAGGVGRGIAPRFVIRRSSPDYRRLKKYGRVVAAGSLTHKLLSLVCEVRAVSQTDKELYAPIEPRLIKDILMRQTRVFLQHGITKDDISGAYSRFAQGFDLVLTAAYPEYFSMLGNPRYGLDHTRIALTGFPRHDLLGGEAERLILVAPTWRKALFGAQPDAHHTSEYPGAWLSLLSPEALPALAARYGYRVALLPHRNARPLFEGSLPRESGVELVRGARYAELISRASLLITDYSSVSFESVYLGRPVVYYQFDESEFYRTHTCREGYFDTRRDGFGEVAVSERELLCAIERCLAADCRPAPQYAERAEGFFAYRDGDSSRRAYEATERAVLRKRAY